MAVDISPYLLGGAGALVKREDLEGVIKFQEENAEVLSFSDDRFDVTLSFTLLEEGNAHRMLQEMVRATKRGGRVATAVRATDVPFYINFPLPTELKRRVEATPFGAVADKGCADASLYSRFQQAGLTQVKMFPHLAVFDNTSPAALRFCQQLLMTPLSPEERNEWQKAEVQAEAVGTYFIAGPFHCVVGTKP